MSGGYLMISVLCEQLVYICVSVLKTVHVVSTNKDTKECKYKQWANGFDVH